MTYNISFLISALVFLLLILYHFVNRKKLDDSVNRIFRLFILLGIMDILFDLLTTILISHGSLKLAWLSHILLTVFYILQALVPYAMFLYCWFLCKTPTKRERIIYWLMSLPVIFMEILVLCNYRTGIFFSVDQYGNYIHGPFYLGMYLYAVIYCVLVLFCSIARYRKLGYKNFCIICEFLVIMGVCVAIQGLHNELLTTGLGLGLGITALYLTINNPSDYTDLLTGDFNIRSFLGWLEELFRKKQSFHLLTVTIQNLSQINLLFGISSGDACLEMISRKLNELLESPYVFRVSSRRFALITYSLKDYERVRAGLMDFFQTNLPVAEETISLRTVICGILHGEKMGDSDSLLAYTEYLISLAPPAADTLMIQSDENTRKGFRRSKEIEQFLLTAIEEDLFEIAYQPVFSIEKGDYIALEALSRLRHPSLGLIPPDVFISIAERNGTIARIGLLQLKRICRFVSEHPQLLSRIDHINFNLSPAELLREGYSRQLLHIIEEYALPCSFFQFEITETVATEYSEQLYRLVEDCTKCGIQFSLDDFGSGYANLNTVLRLPFSSIKLDRSLLNDILRDDKALLFYRNIVTALHSMGYCVIAEGVESRQQLDLLSTFDVDMIQGYYFSKPLGTDELFQLLFPENHSDLSC